MKREHETMRKTKKQTPTAVAERLALPDGYTIIGEDGAHSYLLPIPGSDLAEQGATRSTIAEATVDAWSRAMQLEQDKRHRDVAGSEARLRFAFAELEQTRADLARHRRVLQQIDEIASGKRRSGREFDGIPEQVVADVGHALRVESGHRLKAPEPSAVEAALAAWAPLAWAAGPGKDAP